MAKAVFVLKSQTATGPILVIGFACCIILGICLLFIDVDEKALQGFWYTLIFGSAVVICFVAYFKGHTSRLLFDEYDVYIQSKHYFGCIRGVSLLGWYDNFLRCELEGKAIRFHFKSKENENDNEDTVSRVYRGGYLDETRRVVKEINEWWTTIQSKPQQVQLEIVDHSKPGDSVSTGNSEGTSHGQTPLNSKVEE